MTTETPETTESTAAATDGSTARRRRLDSLLPASVRARRIAVVVLAVALAVATAAAVLFGIERYQDARAATAAREGVQAATTLTPALLSYDWRTIDADAARIDSAGTGRFAEENRAILAGLVKPAAIDGKAVSKATVSSTALISSVPDQAVVLVFFTQTTTLDGAPGPRIDNRSARVTVVPTDDGRWLVAGFDAV